MNDRNFRKMLENKWSRGKFLCIGLDSEFDKIPISVRTKAGNVRNAMTHFNRAIVEATMDLCGVYKINPASYRAHGNEGMDALQRSIAEIHAMAPETPVILDAKYGDIGNTNLGYEKEAFDLLHADAVTVHPYLGGESLWPFLNQRNKGIFVLCKTSNPGSGEFQDLEVVTETSQTTRRKYTQPLYQVVADRVAKKWNKNGNCGLVVGATYPNELREVRSIVGEMSILNPGLGEQGADLEQTISAGMDKNGQGIIVSASQSIIFAGSGPDFAKDARREAEKYRNVISILIGRR